MMGKTPNTKPANHRPRLDVHQNGNQFTVRLRDINALDHSDVCLLKRWMNLRDDYPHIAIDLTNVGYLPPGFFGMLHEQVDSGQRISVLNAAPHIMNQIWYKRHINDDGEFIVPSSPWSPKGHAP